MHACEEIRERDHRSRSRKRRGRSDARMCKTVHGWLGCFSLACNCTACLDRAAKVQKQLCSSWTLSSLVVVVVVVVVPGRPGTAAWSPGGKACVCVCVTAHGGEARGHEESCWQRKMGWTATGRRERLIHQQQTTKILCSATLELAKATTPEPKHHTVQYPACLLWNYCSLQLLPVASRRPVEEYS